MSVQITVIGLGQIGTSIGLSLAKYPERIQRIGYDRALDIQNKAKGLGAFDAVKFSLPDAIEGADLVLLCIPLDQIEETLRLIGPDLHEDAVVMDFSPQKVLVSHWFEQYIPARRHYIGLVASINAQLLDQVESGIDAARSDLFVGATLGIAVPSGATSEAMKLAADLVELLGGQTIFLDMLEADGMLMTAHILPQVISAALLNATVGQPGWTEARRFAGRPFSQSTAALGSDTLDALAQSLLHNPIGAASILDNAIGALTHLRAAIINGDREDLQKRLNLALSDREKWLNERLRAQWDAPTQKSDQPKGGSIFKRLFVGERTKEKK